jgi:hypothetical protein
MGFIASVVCLVLAGLSAIYIIALVCELVPQPKDWVPRAVGIVGALSAVGFTLLFVGMYF